MQLANSFSISETQILGESSSIEREDKVEIASRSICKKMSTNQSNTYCWGTDSSKSCIQRKFSYSYTHSLKTFTTIKPFKWYEKDMGFIIQRKLKYELYYLATKITKPQNTFTISNDNDLNTSLWPVLQYFKNFSPKKYKIFLKLETILNATQQRNYV